MHTHTHTTQFYIETKNPANPELLHYGQDFIKRAPCTMTSPHYHAFGRELVNNVGPDDSVYVFMLADDLSVGYFTQVKKWEMLAIPAGWIHAVINLGGVARTMATLEGANAGNTVVAMCVCVRVRARASGVCVCVLITRRASYTPPPAHTHNTQQTQHNKHQTHRDLGIKLNESIISTSEGTSMADFRRVMGWVAAAERAAGGQPAPMTYRVKNLAADCLR